MLNTDEIPSGFLETILGHVFPLTDSGVWVVRRKCPWTLPYIAGTFMFYEGEDWHSWAGYVSLECGLPLRLPRKLYWYISRMTPPRASPLRPVTC